MVELGYTSSTSSQGIEDPEFKPSYKIYISGDTLLVDELKEIPQRFPGIDLLLVHLGGTTIPGKGLPLLMVVSIPLDLP